MQDAVRNILKYIGEDPEREGLQLTPVRVQRAYKFLTQGYSVDVKELVAGAVFEEEYDEMVIVKDIDIFSLCEHHLLPFYGKCHVAYLPRGKLIGLSKMARIVEAFARRLQIQERLTTQIANCIQEAVAPLGVGVIVEAFHLCIAMRGVEKQNAVAVTSSMLGNFRKDRSTRMEFLDLIGHRKSVV